jgi:hypothetical protein
LKFNKFQNLLGKKDNKPLYISDEVELPKGREKIDIILSPKFYLIKREDLTIPKEKDALKIAPSIFESFFDSLENIKFVAIKEENSYIFIAIDVKSVLQTLKNDYGIPQKRIGNIFTIQSEISEIENSLKISENKSLILLDGIISEFNMKSENPQEINEYLKHKKRTDYSVKFRNVKTTETGGKGFLYISLIPLFLSASLGLDFWKVSQAKIELQKKIEKAKDEYKLPKTSFQRDSIMKRFKKIEETQGRIRDNISWLKEEKFDKFGKIKRVISSKNQFSFQIEFKDKKRSMQKFTEKVRKRERNANIIEKDELVEVRF